MENKVIVFANQKGGVGKSTLSLLLGCYLNWKKENVCIIDTDLQQTIVGIRKDDLEFYGDAAPYDIRGFDIGTPEVMQDLMESCRNIDGFVLMDAPGNMNQDGLIPMFTNADYIICPFRYDKATLASTGDFVRALQKIRQVSSTMKAQILFIPNNINRKGNLEEKKMWKQVADMFNMIGTVLPPIPSRAALERINSFEITSSQRELVRDTFEKIISITKGE